jgi:hypothetical protein
MGRILSGPCCLVHRKFKGRKIDGIMPFAQGRIRITNLSTGKSHTTPVKPLASALVDSGASSSILPLASLEALNGIGPLEITPAKVMTGNGVKEVLQVNGVEVCLDHCCYRGSVLLVEETPGTMMLGMDFLTQSKAKIDFKRGTMVCGVKPKPVKLRLEERHP